MNKILDTVLAAEANIDTLERNITTIQKDFIANNIPIFEKGSTYNITKIDNGNLFEITQIGTAYNNRGILSQTSTNLNAIFGFDTDKKSPQYQNMLLANKGLMFVYVFSECGKNGKAKKIGARTQTLTEFEITELIKKGNIVLK